MTQSIDLYYDFGSPNAYMAREALKGVVERTGVSVTEHPVLIGGIFKLTNNLPPWMAFRKCEPKMKYMMLEIDRFVNDHNLTQYKFNSHFPVNTLLPMRAATAALEMGVHDQFVEPVFKAMWEESRNIGEADVLTSVLNNAGLDGAALVEAAQDQAIKDKLAANTQAVVDRGAFGIPTMFIGDDMYFGKDRVWMIEQNLKAV